MARCEEVGLDYLDAAPLRFVSTVLVNATPDRVFDHLEDAAAWVRWVPVIRKVEWTSPFPLAAGSTRTVHMAGGLRADEVFLVYDRGERMAFRFEAMSAPLLRAFAEDYQVVDVGLGQSRIDWTLCMTPAGPSTSPAALAAPLMGAEIRRTLRRFARYVDRHP